jgi:hypothetical protein
MRMKRIFYLITNPKSFELITEHYLYPLSDNLKISPKTPLAVTADPAPAP